MKDNYTEIYELYFKDVYSYVYSICRNESVAEEITQETFFKALNRISSFKGNCKIYTWLCQIAKNTFYDYQKKEKRKMPLDDDFEYFDFTIDIEKDFVKTEQSMEAHMILHKLDNPYKEVFTLRVFAELSFKQIGSIFNKSDSWARIIFYRAKNKLLEEMK